MTISRVDIKLIAYDLDNTYDRRYSDILDMAMRRDWDLSIRSWNDHNSILYGVSYDGHVTDIGWVDGKYDSSDVEIEEWLD